MRRVKEITAKEENFRTERHGVFEVIRRDPMQPEPIGTIILTAFRIIGYSPDCDGSLMAEMEQIDKNGEATGRTVGNIGLYPDTDLVVSKKELKKLFACGARIKLTYLLGILFVGRPVRDKLRKKGIVR